MRNCLLALTLVSAPVLLQAQQPAEVSVQDDKLVYGPIQSGDTLWKVAKRFSERVDTPIDDLVDELYEKNRSAFVNGNRNVLMAGSYLTLQQVIEAKVKASLPTFAKIEEAPTQSQVAALGSLQLLTPDETAFDTLFAKLQADLSLAKEAIDTERRAKEALQTQLNDMQLQLKALTELIHLKESELKSLLEESLQLRDKSSQSILLSGQAGSVTAMLANNQLLLLLLSVLIATACVYGWDGALLAIRRLKPAAADTPEAQTSTVKAQPLIQPPVLLSDVDAYLAHGRFAQAQSLLEQGLAQHPNDFDIFYKLLQVYAKSDNPDAYRDKLSRISQHWKQKNPARWQRIETLFQRTWPMAFEGEPGLMDESYDGDPPSDPVQTKLELAKAYIDIGKHDSAVEILAEVVKEGNAQQVQLAQMFLDNIKI